MERIYHHYSDCSLCPLSQSRKSIVFGNGNKNADILIVKSNPTELEDNYSSYLTRDLTFLVQCYKKATKFRESVEMCGERLIESAFITSSVICRPAHVEGAYRGQDRKVQAKEINKCSNRLFSTVYAVDPHVIIAFGSHSIAPFKQVCPNRDVKPRMTGEIGEMFTANIPGVHGHVPYSVIPAPDLHFAEITGDYDYEAGKVAGVIRALQTAHNIVKSLKSEDS